MNGSKRGTPSGWDDADWSEIRQAIVVASAALEIDDEMSVEAIKRIWTRRAQQLARVPQAEEEGEHLQLVPLRLGREVYGVDVQYVFDIRPVGASRITRVPRVPAWVAGVVNLRGRIYSVLDLARFLGLGPADGAPPSGSPGGGRLDGYGVEAGRAPVDRRRRLDGGDGGRSFGASQYLVVVETPGMEITLLADEVLPMRTVPVSRLQEAAGAIRGIRSEYLYGIVDERQTGKDLAGSALVVLNLPALLSDKQLIVYEELG